MSLVCGQLGKRPRTSEGSGRDMRLGKWDAKILQLPTQLPGERSQLDTDLRGFSVIVRVVLQCSTQKQPAGKAASQALKAPQWNKRTDKEGEMGRSNMHVWVDRETGEKPMLREIAGV